mgnify:CR=1 FL=1
MTQIEIPLAQDDNYISFPATSPYNFETIFTSSGIINNIPENGFIKFNPVTQSLEPVKYTEHIEKGVGYDLYVNSPTSLIYDGTEYTMTFDELKSHLLPTGWNLVGVGSNIITPLSWCRIFDHHYNVVTQLEPKNAYWINYDDCVKPTFNTESVLYIVGALGTVLFTIYLLREFRIIGKPMKE